MTGWNELEPVSAILRKHSYEYPAGKPCYTIWFKCPGCNDQHGIGDSWKFNGDYEKPTFSPSFLTWVDPNPRAAEGSKYRTGFRCHSFIRNGMIEFCGDCTHALAGQTVAIPPWEDPS